MRSTLPWLARAAGLALVLIAGAGCSTNQLIDIAMHGAPHATSHRDVRVGDRLVLAGDMHCHVLPPDAPHHVSRDLPEAIALAADESLDFVVLTPHVPARFFMDDEIRAWVLGTQQQLRARLESLRPAMMVVPGFEYTDYRYGHVGVAFADPAEVLEGLSARDAQASPERFFEMWIARGGVLTINHPVNRALVDPPFAQLRADMSWRAFRGVAVPAEIDWISRHAQALETFNESATHLRDQFLLDDEERSLREASHLADRIAREQKRRFAAVGGSDSHGHWLRATTFVLAKERSLEALRQGITSARTCVRGPEACTLQLRLAGAGNAWLGVGDAIRTDAIRTDASVPAGVGSAPAAARVAFEARASGDDVTFIVNGTVAARAESGELAALSLPADRCSTVRAIVGRSWSSAVYVNCF